VTLGALGEGLDRLIRAGYALIGLQTFLRLEGKDYVVRDGDVMHF
jgi:ribosome-binding ATPase YchF (GTP1/OBG family)